MNSNKMSDHHMPALVVKTDLDNQQPK
jgi:hypothetical protein